MMCYAVATRDVFYTGVAGNKDKVCVIQGVTGGTDQTSGERSLGHTIPI